MVVAPHVEGDLMMKLRLLLSGLLLLPVVAKAELYITIVQGLGGNEQYQGEFDAQRLQIAQASHTLVREDHLSTFSGADATRAALLEHFAALKQTMQADDRAVIYLIGHGSYDGFDYKFNLPGPDIDANDIKQILSELPGRNHFLLNTSSTSGAMLEALTGTAAGTDSSTSGNADNSDSTNSASDNIIVTATRNGVERNATQFGKYFSEALTNSAADLNKNNNISIQEAFDFATHQVEAYFTDAGKLATEHAQLAGNGAAQFSLARLGSNTPQIKDTAVAPLLEQRQALDAAIEELQLRRGEYNNAEYVSKLQALILQSAELSEKIDAAQQGTTKGATE